MIKKNTKIVFQDGDIERTEDLRGGMPLSKGEVVNFHDGDSIVDYEVMSKKIDYLLEGDDHVVNITYVLKKRE